MQPSLSQFSQQLEQRLAVMRELAASLESGCVSLSRNDLEAIERGTDCQAQLCRRWAQLEEDLRRAAELKPMHSAQSRDNFEARRSEELQQQWVALSDRIRYLTRVHWSLLRHFQRSLNVLARLVESSAPTYAPQVSIAPSGHGLRAGE